MKVCPACNRKYPDKMTLCSADAAVLQRLEDPLIGATLAGKYKVDKLIKTGGMGSVYRGRHVLMDKTVAIKVLRPSLAGDDAVVARFSREAKAASRISHPHAVSVTDFGEAENGVVFLVMEYLDGHTLKELIASEGPLTLDRVVEIVRQVAGALDVAHDQGVIHRDLKSENILLVRHNGAEWAKVLDFGIAKILQPAGGTDSEITHANLVVGTPQYMSPEQCSQSGALDARSDVYSLGIIVHEMLTGRLPFIGESATVVMMKQVQDPPPSVLTSRSELPVAVDHVIKRALAKQPVDRFQSAGELSAALADAANQPESASAGAIVGAPNTVANTPVPAQVAIDDVDEVTVVRPRDEAVVAAGSGNFQKAAPATIDRFNPWRIILPAAIALVAVFAVVFFLTRGTTPGEAIPGQTPLTADPNSTPVQPAGTPSGLSESDVQPAAVATPTPESTRPVGSPTQIPATVTGNFGSNENANTGRGNRNSNQGTQPTPEDEPPPPPPRRSPTVRPAPQRTPAATASPGLR
jgi:eukaryotic-like serine/threonine-protein kinase